MATVYLIKQKNKNSFYVGSSVNYKARYSLHKYNTNTPRAKDYNCPLYKYIRENGGFNNFVFSILEEIENITIKSLREKEQYYIKLYEQKGYLINKRYENQNSYSVDYARKKYYKNYERSKSYNRKCYIKHKETRLEYSKNYDSQKCYNKFTNKICTYSALKKYFRKHEIKESPIKYLVKGALNG